MAWTPPGAVGVKTAGGGEPWFSTWRNKSEVRRTAFAEATGVIAAEGGGDACTGGDEAWLSAWAAQAFPSVV